MESNMAPGHKSPLFWFGMGFTVIGLKTLYEPRYYFRGAYVDFTGHNIQVGCSLVVVGIVFIFFSFYKKNK